MNDMARIVENSSTIIQAYEVYEQHLATESADDAAPSILWHYTTVAAMQQILDSGRVWATDAQFMNDSTEFVYGRDLLFGEVKDFLADPPGGYGSENLELIGRAIERIRMDKDGWRVFLACFCEDGDLLSQWRGYGIGAIPVALGFDLTRFTQADQGAALDECGKIRQVMRLQRARYTADEQRELVRRVLDVWRQARTDFCNAAPYGDSEEPNLAMLALEALLENLIVQFKHASFAEEREWRLTCNLYEVVDDVMDQVRHVAAYFGPKPYIRLDLSETKRIEGVDVRYELPLRAVRIGPTPHADIAAQAVKGFLRAKDYHDVALSRSEVPLR